MLRKRLVTVLTFNDGVLFRTKLFEPDYRYTANFVDAWSVDEIVVLDITRPGTGDRANFEAAVHDLARRCFVPLSVGGGIRTLADVERLLQLGADKVVVNTGALERPELITDIARRYGSQCVVLSVDARRKGEGWEVHGRFAAEPTGLDPAGWARHAVALGAGEVLVTAIERDGWLQGYDLPLCRHVVDAVPVPVLICGGAGNWQHMIDGVVVGGADAVCTQNIYHFTETSILAAKRALAKAGVAVRLDAG